VKIDEKGVDTDGKTEMLETMVKEMKESGDIDE